MDLRAVYLETLARCTPERLVREHLTTSMPRTVVAIGKCAGALLDGVADVIGVERAFVAMPEGYRLPRTEAEVWLGGHPLMTPESFAAGRALLAFLERSTDVLFLISGGGSACVEVPLSPYSEAEVADANARLIAAGLPIRSINAERKKLSAIKGGRLRQYTRGRAVTLVYSDVSTGALTDVASGPTIEEPDEAILIADNRALTAAAAELAGERAVRIDEQLECDVAEAARLLAERAANLQPGQILVAGGEPTVQVRGNGRGGRCSELAVRFAMISPLEALFGSSDGADGNSGVAAIHLPPRQEARSDPSWEAALAGSNSFQIASQVGEPIMIAPAGNNLRDLFLVARD